MGMPHCLQEDLPSRVFCKRRVDFEGFKSVFRVEPIRNPTGWHDIQPPALTVHIGCHDGGHGFIDMVKERLENTKTTIFASQRCRQQRGVESGICSFNTLIESPAMVLFPLILLRTIVAQE